MNSQITVDIASIVAIIVGPIAALGIQRWADNRRENRKTKRWVFTTLMTYRATRLNQNFVQALNVIDVVFNGKSEDERQVRTSWKVLLDHLGTDQQPQASQDKAVDLTIKLLVVMGRVLDYEFDEVHLKRQVYLPVGHAEVEREQNELRQKLLRVLRGDLRIPIAVFQDTFPPLAIPPQEEEDGN